MTISHKVLHSILVSRKERFLTDDEIIENVVVREYILVHAIRMLKRPYRRKMIPQGFVGQYIGQNAAGMSESAHHHSLQACSYH